MSAHYPQVVVLMAVLAAAGCGSHAREPWPEGADGPGHDPHAVTVTVAPVQHRTVQRTVEAVGTLWGYEEVSLSAKVEGRVRRILHDVSDRVKPGEQLLEIDPTDYELSARQADKALAVELAKLGLTEIPPRGYDVMELPTVVQAQARLENARLRLDRAKTAGRGTSAEDLADKGAEFRVAKAEHDNQILLARAGVASVRVKQEALAMARQQLEDTRIRAPVPTQTVPGAESSGPVYAITSRASAEGTFVKSGTEVFKLVIDQSLKLRLRVPERHVAEVRLGQAAEVRTVSYAAAFAGSVTRINPSVDPVSRTFEVEVLVPNPGSELKAGSFAKAVIRTSMDAEAVTVPLESVVSFAGIQKVFVVENGKAREAQVCLGVQDRDWAEVCKPRLARGALVVTSGLKDLADGTPVVVRSESASK
jgi:RND family efflux transporter MFP subunit